MKKIYYILGLAMLSLCISCEDSKGLFDDLFKEETIDELLNAYQVADVTTDSAVVKSDAEADQFRSFEDKLYSSSYYSSSSRENKLKLLVRESAKAPEDVETFFKNAQTVDYTSTTDNHIQFVIRDLKPNTTYYCVTYFSDGLADTYGSKFISFTTKNIGGDPLERSAIDLGLSVKWANMNLGSSKVTDIGNTYELENAEKDIYQTKYDVAIQVWGQPWRMPTKEEAQELIDKCTWKFTSISGVEGYQVTGPNKKSIFIPCTNNTTAWLWTGSYNNGKFYYRLYVHLNDDDRIRNEIDKYINLMYYYYETHIRAVQAK